MKPLGLMRDHKPVHRWTFRDCADYAKRDDRAQEISDHIVHWILGGAAVGVVWWLLACVAGR